MNKKTSLQEKANAYFKGHPILKKVFMTPDGYIFVEKNRAEMHAKSIEGAKVYTINNTVELEETTDDKSNDVDSLNAVEMYKLIKSTDDASELESLLNSENTRDQPRKKVAQLLENRIVELKDPS